MMTDFPKPPPGGRRMSAEPNWPEWPYTLARVMDHLTHNAATLEDREAVWRAIADFDRQCRQRLELFDRYGP